MNGKLFILLLGLVGLGALMAKPAASPAQPSPKPPTPKPPAVKAPAPAAATEDTSTSFSLFERATLQGDADDLYTYALVSPHKIFVTAAADKLVSLNDVRASDLTLRLSMWSGLVVTAGLTAEQSAMVRSPLDYTLDQLVSEASQTLSPGFVGWVAAYSRSNGRADQADALLSLLSAAAAPDLTADDLTHPQDDSALMSLQPRPAPPTLIDAPQGWQYIRDMREVPKDAIAEATKFLHSASLGQFADYVTWGLLKEWHYDDHVSPGLIKWHAGVSVLTPRIITV